MPPPGMGLRQVMSPRAPNLCPAQLRASVQLIDQNITVQRGEEEMAARGVAFEAQMVVKTSAREEALTRELQEIHFAQALSLQAQQEMQYWEHQQRKTFATPTSYCGAPHVARSLAEKPRCRSGSFAKQPKSEDRARRGYRQGIHNEAEAFAQ